MKNKFKLVCGVGINDASYNINIKEELPKVNGKRKQKFIWVCPYYQKWLDMIKRCYRTDKSKNPTYKDCSVCNEWLTFSNFKKWMETQDWEGKALDKDLLIYQNKVYSPETCCFVPQEINSFLTKCNKSRGQHPLGVDRIKRCAKFRCRINNGTGGNEYLGLYASEQAAHKAWQLAKMERCMLLIEQQTDTKVIAGLERVYIKIQNDYINNIETVDF
ncbi:MAG: hypothetical protein EOM41_01390 [Bacilli bacterium]|nr:hypothetical protein [Bacilli bacterium]